jgi:5'-3' exonuclease
VPSGEGRRKRRKYLNFDQLLFLLPHVEDRTTHSNLRTPSNENEEDEDTSREEEKEVPRIVRQRKRTKMSYEESLLQILREKKKEDTDIDEDRCFLLSLLPSFRQFNDEQNFWLAWKS